MTLFEKICAELGENAFYSQPNSFDEILLQRAKLQLLPAVKSGSHKGKPMQLEIGWIDNPTFNAWAHTDKGVDFIGINIGTLIILRRFFQILVSHPSYLAQIKSKGDFHHEKFKFDSLIKTFPNDAAEWPEVAISDPKRAELALNLCEGAFYYVVYHEMYHIYNGHTDLINDAYGTNHFKEIKPSNEISFSGLTSQTLEFDADTISAQMIIKMALNPKIEYVHGREKWILDEAFPFGDLHQTMAVIISTIFATHAFFSPSDELANENYKDRAHPPSIIRMFLNMHQIFTILWFRTTIPENELDSFIKPAFEDFQNAINNIIPNQAKPDIGINIESMYLELFNKYSEEWSRLHPLLDERKRGGTLAPPKADNKRLSQIEINSSK